MQYVELTFPNNKVFFTIKSLDNVTISNGDFFVDFLNVISVKEERTYVFFNVNIYAKAIKKMFWENNFEGVESSLKTTELDNNEFQAIGNVEIFYGFKFKYKDSIYLLKSLTNLVPRLDYKRVNQDEFTAYSMALKKYQEQKLNGFTLASSCWNKWKKGHLKDIYGKRFNYIKWDNEIYNYSVKLGDFGLNLINPKYKNKIVNNVYIFDRNSQYPYIALNYPLPTDQPLEFKDIKEFQKQTRYTTYFVVIRIYFATIKKGLFPFLNTSDNDTVKIPNSINNETLVLWKDEFQEFKKRYTNLSFKILKVYGVKLRKNFFSSYFPPLFEMKQTARANNDYLSSYFAKSQMNMLLGKFAQNRFATQYLEYKEGKFKVVNSEDIFRYSLLFSYITMKARLNEEFYINVVFKNQFVYCDTDSLFIKDFKKKQAKYLSIDPFKIGAFKLEHIDTQLAIKNRKQYSELTTEGEILNTIAGADTSLTELLEPEEFLKCPHVYKREEWDTTNLEPKKKIVNILI
ncbi:MAG: DNA polymerase [Clostridia bacterium]